MRKEALVFGILAVLAVQQTALASDSPAHFHVALKAFDEAPAPLRKLLLANLPAYLAGSTGPDIAQTAYVMQEAMNMEHPGSYSHAGGHTGDIIVNMLRAGMQLNDPADRDTVVAFALGWATHYATDCVIHPLINEFGGDYYNGGAVRHKHLELLECEHVFTTGDPRTLQNVVDPKTVPVDAIVSAIREVAPLLSTAIYSDFRQVLEGSAHQMNGCTIWMRSVHAGTAYDGPGAFKIGAVRGTLLFPIGAVVPATSLFSTALKGTPPTPRQYRRIMEPIKIESVDWEFPDELGNDAKLKVRYKVNDVRLHGFFCEAWNQRVDQAVAMAAAYLRLWSDSPDGFTVPNLNLSYGAPDGVGFSPANENPGNPEISRMLGRLSILGDRGADVTPWPMDGEWLPITFQGEKVWLDYPAGGGELVIPFRPDGSEWYEVKLRLGLADESRRIYGADLGKPIEAVWTSRIRHPAKPGEIEIVSAAVTPDAAEVGQPVDLSLVYRVRGMREEQVTVTEGVEVLSDALAGRPLSLGPQRCVIARPDGGFDATVKVRYRARLTKPGAYSFGVDLESAGYRQPEGRSLSFRVTPGAVSGSKPGAAPGMVRWVRQAPEITGGSKGDWGKWWTVTSSDTDCTFTAKSPGGGSATSTVSWQAPPASLTAGQEFTLSASCNADENLDVAADYGFNGCLNVIGDKVNVASNAIPPRTRISVKVEVSAIDTREAPVVGMSVQALSVSNIAGFRPGVSLVWRYARSGSGDAPQSQADAPAGRPELVRMEVTVVDSPNMLRKGGDGARPAGTPTRPDSAPTAGGGGPGTAMAREQLKKAKDLLAAGLYTTQAQESLREAVRLDPSLAEAWLLLGQEALGRHEWAEAEKALNEVVRLTPSDPEGHAYLAIALYRQNKRDEAMKHFKEAERLGVDHDHPMYHEIDRK